LKVYKKTVQQSLTKLGQVGEVLMSGAKIWSNFGPPWVPISSPLPQALVSSRRGPGKDDRRPAWDATVKIISSTACHFQVRATYSTNTIYNTSSWFK